MAAVAIAIPRPSSPTIESQRTSFISSSAASFQTAQSVSPRSPSTPQSFQSSSPSSSSHTLSATLPPTSDFVNPIHVLAPQSQEVHLVKVTDDSVQLEAGHPPESFLHKVGKTITSTAPSRRPPTDSIKSYDIHSPQLSADSDDPTSKVGPPPPSPPASEEYLGENGPLPKSSPHRSESKVAHRPLTFETPMRERMPSATSTISFDPSVARQPRAGPSQLSPRASADTKASFLTGRTGSSTMTTRGPPSSQPHHITDQPARFDATTSQSSPPRPARSMSSNISTDGFLQPPPLTLSRQAKRRNTIGSSTSPMAPLITGYDDINADGELASEIQQQQEQILRERLSKRAKAQQEAEAALTRAKSDPERPLVGNWIKEGHENYVLMYNMLTGIRTAVSRCQAKLDRSISDEDYTAAHKYSFDILGNELTPSVKYDFKFKDYAPWVFRHLREEIFHLDPADYLLSLTEKYILSELGSPGKSGSFFYFSRDYRFIIKTIHHSEHKFIRSILKQYHEHVKSNPHTLLSRFYGLHRVKLPRGRKIHFVIMNNLFPPHRDIHETYDLKGSTVGRIYPEDEAAKKQNKVTLKDLNWINRNKTLELGPEKRALLTEQLRRDSELLKKVHVMDYSLLVGIHNMKRGNKDNLRRNTLKVFSVPDVQIARRKTSQLKGTFSPEAIAMRRAMRESDPKRMDSEATKLPDRDTGDERQHFIFYQDEGGLRATDEANDHMDTIYYVGIIDICTPYTSFKRIEHIWKGMQADRHKISPVEPGEYADRFFAFLTAVMRGGEGGGRFKAE